MEPGKQNKLMDSHLFGLLLGVFVGVILTGLGSFAFYGPNVPGLILTCAGMIGLLMLNKEERKQDDNL